MAKVLKNTAFGAGSVTQDKIAASSFPGTAFESGPEPKITSTQVTNAAWSPLSKTWVSITGGYVVITGLNFRSGAQAIFGTTPAISTTFVSSTTLRVRAPALAVGSYFLYVVNPDGGTALRVNGISYA